MYSVGDVAARGLCIGCTVCLGACPKGALEVEDGTLGFLVPLKHENCDNCGACIRECPPYQQQYGDDNNDGEE